MDYKISDPTHLAAILAYCKAVRQPMWVTHTPAESTIGGFSCELLSIEGDTAVTRIANGDVFRRPIAQIHACAIR